MGVVDGEKILVQPLRPLPSQIHSCNKSSDISQSGDLVFQKKTQKQEMRKQVKQIFFPLECVFVGLLKTTENIQHDHTPL